MQDKPTISARSIACVCKRCGAAFSVERSRFNAGKGHYCSQACYFARAGDPVERFWSLVKKDGPIPAHRPELGPCWPWQGRTKRKYGVLRVGSRNATAHRRVWELARGPIPDGLEVLHHCDNPPCCNPDHLFLGTQGDNIRDMVQKGRARSGGTRGETHGMAKLTEAQVRAIRGRYAGGGETLFTLAAEFGVTFSMIGMIVRRQSWKHVA